MASVSISHLVLFIASILIAAAVAGTLVTGVDRVSDALSDHSLDTSESIETDISIISDTGSDAIYDGSNVTVLVKNTGDRTLTPDVDRIDVLVNGVFVPSSDLSATVVDSSAPAEWAPGEVLELEIDETLDAGEQRVSVTVNGNEDLLEFRVTE